MPFRGALRRLLERAAIPKRYEHCILESFELFNEADPSLVRAHMIAHKFVAGYPVETEGKGLLLTGAVGVGKTHLAVGILQALILEKGVRQELLSATIASCSSVFRSPTIRGSRLRSFRFWVLSLKPKCW